MATPSSSGQHTATLGMRVAAYLIDSIVLLALLLIFFVIGGAVLLFTSDLGKNDAPDAAYSAFIAILIGGPLLFWSLLNLALSRWRAQTVGMYITGIKAEAEDIDARTPRRVLLRWFGMNPVLYHPFFVPIWIVQPSAHSVQTVFTQTSGRATHLLGASIRVADHRLHQSGCDY